MTLFSSPIFLQLIIAHIIGDFLLQNDKMVNDRERHHWRSPLLLLHAAIHALLFYVVVGHMAWWMQPIAFGACHWGVDVWKSYQKPGRAKIFLVDQFAHVFCILLFVAYQPSISVTEQSSSWTGLQIQNIDLQPIVQLWSVAGWL